MSEAIQEEQAALKIQQLTQQVVSCLYDNKAHDIAVLDVEGRTSYCDRLVLCSGSSGRQVRALAGHVMSAIRQSGNHPLGTEGLGSGRWVLVDLGAVVVHIFDEESRSHYDLDGMWADANKITLSSLGVSEEEPPSSETAPVWG